MPGYWRRPIARVYSYNLDLGETYYSPMKDYLEKERRERGETPGALTYSERIARTWCGGDKVLCTVLFCIVLCCTVYIEGSPNES